MLGSRWRGWLSRRGAQVRDRNFERKELEKKVQKTTYGAVVASLVQPAPPFARTASPDVWAAQDLHRDRGYCGVAVDLELRR